MRVSKEFKTGLVVVLSILLLIFGVNYLKGNSFFGGDEAYYAYFPQSGGLTPSSSVTLNGVEVGKVIDVQLQDPNIFVEANKRVIVKFNIQDASLIPAMGASLEIVPGLLDVGMTLKQDYTSEKFHKVGDTLMGTVSQDIAEQLEDQILPVKAKLESLMSSIDGIVVSVNAFWDTSAAYSLDASLAEVQTAIKRFGNVAYNLDNLITDEKVKLGRILANVDKLTASLNTSMKQVNIITKNFETISDDLLTADFKSTINKATTALDEFGTLMEQVNSGEGTVGKLLKDDKFYNNLNTATSELNELVDDIKIHPERYIHISVFGAKTKGVPLTKEEEKKLRELLQKAGSSN